MEDYGRELSRENAYQLAYRGTDIYLTCALIWTFCYNVSVYPSIFDNLEVEKELDTGRLHDQFVPIPADKAGNNIVFVCKAHYINCTFMLELSINSAILPKSIA